MNGGLLYVAHADHGNGVGHGSLLIWIFQNDVVLLVREAEAQYCAALVRASAARREEESGAGLVQRNFAEGFPVLLSKP